jgi:hypothetical protein
MRGGNRTRLCEHCQLHVQNLSVMSRRDMARVLLPGHAGRVCITYVRGVDGRLVTRAALLRERFLSAFGRAFAYHLRALGSVARVLCSTPQKKLFVGTWKVIERGRGADKADRITFNEDHSFVSSTSNGVGETKVDVRGIWCADRRNIYMWCEGKTSIWQITDLLPDELRLQSTTRVAVYKRVGKTPLQASGQSMPFRQAQGPELAERRPIADRRGSKVKQIMKG